MVRREEGGGSWAPELHLGMPGRVSKMYIISLHWPDGSKKVGKYTKGRNRSR